MNVSYWCLSLILHNLCCCGKFPGNAGINMMLSPKPSGVQPTTVKEIPSKVLQELPSAANGTGHNHTSGASISGSAPAAK